MKRLLWILIGLLTAALLLVAGLYLVGGGTQEYRASIEILAPPEEVFPWLVEPQRIGQWVSGVTEVRPLTEGGHAVGAQALVVVEENGERFEFTDVVVASEDNRLLEVDSESSIFTAHNRWELRPTPVGTHLEVTMRARFHGFFRLFAPFMKSEAQQQLQSDFETLKRLIESTNGQSPAPALGSPPTVNEPMPAEPLSPAPPERETSDTENWMTT